MALRFLSRPSRVAALIVAVVAFTLAMGLSAAYAEEAVKLDPAQVQAMFEQLQSEEVVNSNCEFCHANISETDNYASEIIFTHGNHILVQCSACHSRFPHQREGTSRPTMKGCFNCHGLQHGPAGNLASGECEDCHMTRRESLRPSFHVWDWAAKPHVDPANKEFNTRCAMCHTPQSCNECHDYEGVNWTPAKWEYDSSVGCQSCHGSAMLQKAGIDGPKSFQITGVDESVHQNVTCQECHVDFRYDEKPARTKLWNVNVSYACAECHRNADTGDKELDKKLSAPVAAYNKSVHAKGLQEGRYDNATCGSCHGGHFIYSLETTYNKQRMHLSAYRVCARCKQHGEDYDTYDDYYHGKAYKKGAADAPSCWDCHDSHKIQKKSDPESTVYTKNVGTTCGQEGCHKGSGEEFGDKAKMLIHDQGKTKDENPLVRVIGNITGR